MIRRLVVAALVALLAFGMVGCGGGGEEPPAEQAETPPAAPETPVPVPVDGAVIPDRSLEETVVFEPFPTGDFVPKEITERLASVPKQPMILFFYDDAQLETDDARTEVVTVSNENRGAVDLIEFNLGKYTSVNTSGVVAVDEGKLDVDEQGKQAVTLARELGVKFTPFVVVVDDQGYVIFKWRGYISAEMLGRQVARTKD